MLRNLWINSQRKFSSALSFSSLINIEQKTQLVERLLAAKLRSGLTFTEIAKKCNLTNAYTAQLFLNQAQLKPETAQKLKSIVSGIREEDLLLMQAAPNRHYDPLVTQDPTVYRLQEAILHYGQGMKAIINEEFGDGIMSSIDMRMKIEKRKGSAGEDRVVITLDGKFLSHIEQID